jgi:mannose-6-phosphate isomerase-like protein (cupin superfamily)
MKISLDTAVTRKRLFDGVGEAVIESLFEPGDFSTTVRLCARITLPPGGSIGHHVHRREDELYYILSGTGIVTDAGDSFRVGPGSAVLTRDGEGHSLENTGSEDMTLLAVIPVSPAER